LHKAKNHVDSVIREHFVIRFSHGKPKAVHKKI